MKYQTQDSNNYTHQDRKLSNVKEQKFAHYLLYCVSYLVYGMVFTSLGPMFPYLSEYQGRIETQYTFLYTCRAIGYISGSLAIKMFEHKFCLHTIILTGIASIAIFNISFCYFDNFWMKGFFVFASSIGGSFIDIALNLAVIKCFTTQKVSYWLQVIHGVFGIGGFMGPFIVYLFELQAFLVLGLIFSTLMFFYLRLASPQIQQKKQNQDIEQLRQFRHIPPYSLHIISIIFFFTVGQQTSFGGWISSFAVLKNFSTKEHANLYSSVYWISITFFRFVMAYVPGSSSKKIQILGIIGVLNSIVGYYLIYNVNSQFGLNFMSIMYGLCNSALFPLLLTIPEQFGFKFTIKQTSTFITWSALGEGCLAVGVGKMMDFYSYNWLIYGMLIMDLIITILCRANEMEMLRQKQRVDKELNKQLIEYQDGRMNQEIEMKMIKA